MIRSDSGGAAAFSRLLQQIREISESAGNVAVCQGPFQEISSFFLKVGSLLRDLQDGTSSSSISSLYTIVQPLESELKNAKDLVDICTAKSRFYLVLNCRTYRDRIREILNSVASSLSQMPFDDAHAGPNLKKSIKLLCDDIQRTEIMLSREESDLMDTVDHMSLGYTSDDARNTSELLGKIAIAARVPSDSFSLAQEYEKLKRERELMLPGKHEIGLLQFRQVMATLNSAGIFGSTTERSRQYHEQRREMDSDFIPPLQTFNCPITQEIMENPVEIESGHTFEMVAIQRWFEEGHRVCPVTKSELQNFSLKPNRLLRQSIEEWRDLNTMKKISKFGGKLKSDDDEAINSALIDIQRICVEKSIHKYWIASEGLIPLLVGHLGSSKGELRKQVLATLSALSADNSENRVLLCDAGTIGNVVRSLARDTTEAKLAVNLLLELSREETLRERILKVQGCILLLVTIANSENTPAAVNAKELLKMLATNDDSVSLMANYNYFKPLLQSLDQGSWPTQTLMANTLAQMELSDQNKTLLVQGGVLVPLVKMLSVGNYECKAAALGALESLSDLPENRDRIIGAGVMQPLLEILLTVKSVTAAVREHAAATFANLAAPSSSFCISDLWGTPSQTEEVIVGLAAILNLTGSNIQRHVLRALYSICSNPASMRFAETFKDVIGIQIFVRFIEAKVTDLRLNALKLLFLLTKDGGGEVLSTELTVESYRTMVDLFASDSLEEEKVVAMGILSLLPMKDKVVTQDMIDAGVRSSVITILRKFCSRMSSRDNTELVENAAKVLIRFTRSSDIELQLDTAKSDVISLLVNLLNFGTPLTKCWAATSLMQFSESTPSLCMQSKGSGGCFCFMRPQEPNCVLHGGPCSLNSTFCLLEANAISPLIQALEGKDENTDDAALGALVTLVADMYWEKGSDIIVKHGGVKPILRKLTTQNTKVQEKALLILEKVFRKKMHKENFGQIAQMPLVSLTQDGTSTVRPLAAKILAHLNILHEQSSYF